MPLKQYSMKYSERKIAQCLKEFHSETYLYTVRELFKNTESENLL